MHKESISIIVITLNEQKRIKNILQDLANQTFQQFEVLVIDSNSDDNTCEVAESFTDNLPDLTVHRMKNRGVCLGRNTGAKLAKYEKLLFLDADVRLSTQFLEKVMFHANEASVKVAGVYLKSQDSSKIYSFGYNMFNAGMFLTQYTFPTAVGACLFSTKDIHQKINGFDETVTLCEDCDYVKRASKFTKFRMLPVSFAFDARRLKQDGCISTTRKYLHANVHRFFIGEIRNNKIKYKFNHYVSDEV